MKMTSLFTDPRYFQIFFLTLFHIYGNIFLEWSIPLENYLVIGFGAFITQAFAIYFYNLKINSLLSAWITALGIGLLLHSNHIYLLLFASVLAISAKFIFRIHGKHYINPANFAIVICLFLSQDAWISPAQWGYSGNLLMLVGGLGLMVSSRAHRLDAAIWFLIPFLFFQSMRTLVYQDWPLDHLLQSMNMGSLLLFSFFMITDPASTPYHPVARKIWSISIAFLSFYFLNFKHIYSGAPLYALFLIAFTTPLWNWVSTLLSFANNKKLLYEKSIS